MGSKVKHDLNSVIYTLNFTIKVSKTYKNKFSCKKNDGMCAYMAMTEGPEVQCAWIPSRERFFPMSVHCSAFLIALGQIT